MVLAAAIYNLAMLVVDAVALRRIRLRQTTGGWIGAGLAAGAAAMVLAFVLGMLRTEDNFRAVALAAWGLFVHGPLLLAASAVILWRSRPKTAAASAVLAVAVLGIAVDAFFVEPHWLEASRITLASPKIARPVRVVVVADPQLDELDAYERQALKRAMDEKPDLLLLAGDYIQVGDDRVRRRLEGDLHDYLREIGIAAPLGVYAVRGNVDEDRWADSFRDLPVTAVESTQSFDLGVLRLTCLSRDASFLYSELKVPKPDPGQYHIVLGHSPNFALRKQIQADLLIAGHTHGGQVQLPLVGPLMTNTRVPRPWASGLHEIRDGTWLLVSRAVGMERGDAPRLRFLCRPELVVIDLVPGD